MDGNRTLAVIEVLVESTKLAHAHDEHSHDGLPAREEDVLELATLLGVAIQRRGRIVLLLPLLFCSLATLEDDEEG